MAEEKRSTASADVRKAHETARHRFRDEVAAKEARLRRHREKGARGFWFGVASFGMVGWSIAVPALIGVAVGLWLDGRQGGGVRFTLSFLVAGLAVGMLNVWRWMQVQEREEDD